jgi:hypothetical protein
VDNEQQLEPLSHDSGCQVLRFVANYIINAGAPAYTWQQRRQQWQQWEPVPLRLLYPINIHHILFYPSSISRKHIPDDIQL